MATSKSKAKETKEPEVVAEEVVVEETPAEEAPTKVRSRGVKLPNGIVRIDN